MDRTELEACVEQGMSTRQIAARYGCSQMKAKYWLGKFGLKTKGIPFQDRKRYGGETSTCEVCGNPSRKGKLCSSCRTTIRRVRLKIAAVRLLGGKCVDCGWEGELEDFPGFSFHHRDGDDKDFAISSVSNKSWEFIKCELAKCDLLCMRCHTIRHSSLRGNGILLSAALRYGGGNDEMSRLIGSWGSH